MSDNEVYSSECKQCLRPYRWRGEFTTGVCHQCQVANAEKWVDRVADSETKLL